LLALLAVAPARATVREPLCEWLSGVAGAAQAQADGDPAAAEIAARRALDARPRGAAAGRASAALGAALAARGAHTEAAEILETALAGVTQAGRAHLAFARAEALLAAGDAPRAAKLLGAVAGSGDLAIARRARWREPDALLAAGLAAEAVPLLEGLLRELPGHTAAPAARLALARGLRALGRDADAAEIYRGLWLERPELPVGRAAGDALESWREAGGPVPPATAAEELARADRLLATGWPDAALHALDAAERADPPPAAERAAVLRAGALVALGRHADAARLAAPLEAAEDESDRRGALLVLARAAARAGRVDEASRRYLELSVLRAPVPGLPEWRQRELGDEAAYLAAWLYYDAAQYARAATALDAFVKANRLSRRADDARWFSAWSLYRLGRGAAAARAFAKLGRSSYADAAAYWGARIARGAPAKRRLYRAAIAAGGDGWYGLLARARLAELGEAAARVPPADARPLPELQDPAAAARLAVAVELLGLGLRGEALEELSELARSWRVRPAAPIVAQLAAFAGDAEIPFRVARDHLLPTRRTLRWAHPEPYPDLLPARARAVGVDPSLLLAVMRRESGFRPGVRSGAGAEGLLQLRPATAERVAAVLGLPVGLGARLGEPEVNITLGAHYLGLLLARFGDPAIAVAAYNAGPAAAAEWARARAGMPLDAWVESIPYRETRGYVRIVLTDWDVYRALAGEPPAPIVPGRTVSAPEGGVSF
jgi:soluble lytic murein transglycosylase